MLWLLPADIAIMFDMNKLWEKFVLAEMQRQLSDYEVNGQNSKYIWILMISSRKIDEGFFMVCQDLNDIVYRKINLLLLECSNQILIR